LGSIIQIIGMVAVTVGASLIALPAGLIVGGVFAILVGFALESVNA
jgi:hypothetical protein